VCAALLDVGGRSVATYIGFDRFFPTSLPSVYLLSPGELGLLPHVDTDGKVCFTSEEGLALDRHNPTGIIEAAIARTIETLSAGMTGANASDFVDEFDAYWLQHTSCLRCDSYIAPTDEAHAIVLMRKGNPHEGYEFAADTVEQVTAFDAGKHPQYTIINALYVPLLEHTLVIPPDPQSFWSVAEFRAIVQRSISRATAAQLQKLTTKHKHEEVIVLKLPRPKGGEVLFGVQCLGVEGAHPLRTNGVVRQMTPIHFRRKDAAFLLPRGGAHRELTRKRVALIGCGSVGGYIAFELARLGIGALVLIDPQRLAVENIFRHVLGKKAVGTHKASALRDELRATFPYLRVTAQTDCVEYALSSGAVCPEEFDCIIVATGETSLSVYLNHYFHSLERVPPVLYSWVEAYGIGGHAVVTLNGTRAGCFECLYTPSLEDEVVFDRSSFAGPNQIFAKNLSGCAGLFTPFGSLDALRTAALATEMVADVLLGTQEGNQLCSWKGSAAAFRAAGYSVSDRYSLTQQQLNTGGGSFASPRCPVCGGRGSDV
jgi:molybdopterin/thiamine biosynthesis adenylyltransferase